MGRKDLEVSDFFDGFPQIPCRCETHSLRLTAGSVKGERQVLMDMPTVLGDEANHIFLTPEAVQILCVGLIMWLTDEERDELVEMLQGNFPDAESPAQEETG